MEASSFPQLSSMVSRADRVVDSDLDEEQALLSMDTGRYYGMSEIGRYIWDLLARPWVVNDLVSMLAAQFKVDRSVCQQDVLDFLGELEQEKLIYVWSDPRQASPQG
jgi:hypothetical protein